MVYMQCIGIGKHSVLTRLPSVLYTNTHIHTHTDASIGMEFGLQLLLWMGCRENRAIDPLSHWAIEHYTANGRRCRRTKLEIPFGLHWLKFENIQSDRTLQWYTLHTLPTHVCWILLEWKLKRHLHQTKLLLSLLERGSAIVYQSIAVAAYTDLHMYRRLRNEQSPFLMFSGLVISIISCLMSDASQSLRIFMRTCVCPFAVV